MHDIAELERRGLPGVFLASQVFVNAASTQSEAIGFSPNRVFVEHPIQDRTDDEMKTIADKALQAIVEKLTVP